MNWVTTHRQWIEFIVAAAEGLWPIAGPVISAR
jgi:hypothetical protein